MRYYFKGEILTKMLLTRSKLVVCCPDLDNKPKQNVTLLSLSPVHLFCLVASSRLVLIQWMHKLHHWTHKATVH